MRKKMKSSLEYRATNFKCKLFGCFCYCSKPYNFHVTAVEGSKKSSLVVFKVRNKKSIADNQKYCWAFYSPKTYSYSEYPTLWTALSAAKKMIVTVV